MYVYIHIHILYVKLDTHTLYTIHYINKLKDRNHMIIVTDNEKVFEKFNMLCDKNYGDFMKRWTS